MVVSATLQGLLQAQVGMEDTDGGVVTGAVTVT